MNTLNGIVANNNLMIVKDGLEKMLSKLLKQSNPNQPLIKQIKDDIERLNESYLYLGEVKEELNVTSKRNKYLESMLISNVAYTKDLKIENLERFKQLEQLKKNLEL